MRRIATWLIVVGLALAMPLAAQDPVGPTHIALSVQTGDLTTQEADENGDALFSKARMVGLAGTVWLGEYAGARLGFARSTDNVKPASAVASMAGQTPTVWVTEAAVMGGYPINVLNGRLLPYVMGTLGTKQYHFGDARSQDDDVYHGYGGGVKYRMGRYGVSFEAREIHSWLDDLDNRLRDRMYSVGIDFHI